MNGPVRRKLGIIPSNVQWGGACRTIEVAPGEGTGYTECTSQRVGKNRRCHSVGFHPCATWYILYPPGAKAELEGRGGGKSEK